MKTKKLSVFQLSIASSLIVLGCFVATQNVFALSAPTLTLPANNTVVAPDTKLTAAGVSANNSTVFLFLDEKLLQGVKVVNGKAGTGSFVFRLPSTLFSYGNHTIRLRSVQGVEKSSYTEARTISVPSTWPRRIDGVVVPSGQANLLPTAVMIENLSIVRPQAGLGFASVVYETLAEGGIPRFMALFARTDMTKVGPVRSARPYYVDWAKEFEAQLMHAGGSRDAFNEVGKLKVRSIDALLGKTAKFFARVGGGESTHNLFTSGSKMASMRLAFSLTTAKATYIPWKFKNDPVLSARPDEKRKLAIDFLSGKAYTVAYYYDRASNSYFRFNGGKQHTDANDKKRTTIRAKNVIVQLVPKEKVLDKKLHISLEIVGKGKGWIAQDGKVGPITWEKRSVTARTIYRLANGNDVAFNRGSIWVEVVPNTRPVTYR